ncbi:MAG TPA: hotdog fold thioesterase [Candidatus Acidoferrales bacterium]|nr:hotdog fold thioesterase [Candidatus Acidoferrales bacterium]
MANLFKNITPEFINSLSKGTMAERIGIEITEIGGDYIKGKMPVDSRTVQTYGILHGGASAALAETLGSVAGMITLDHEKEFCVGLEINANHIRSVRHGYVTGTARPLHIGSRTQVWEIKIENESAQLTCVSRLTLAILQRNAEKNEKVIGK